MFLTTNGRERTRMTALHSSPLSVRGSKHWTGEPVENVMATRMTFGQERMLKVVDGRMRHPNAFHYFSRALIGGNGKRHDLPQPKSPETIVTCSPSGFGSVTVTPIVECQPPNRSQRTE